MLGLAVLLKNTFLKTVFTSSEFFHQDSCISCIFSSLRLLECGEWCVSALFGLQQKATFLVSSDHWYCIYCTSCIYSFFFFFFCRCRWRPFDFFPSCSLATKSAFHPTQTNSLLIYLPLQSIIAVLFMCAAPMVQSLQIYKYYNKRFNSSQPKSAESIYLCWSLF